MATVATMPDTIVEDRRATAGEIRAHRAALKALVDEYHLGNPRLRRDGAIVVSAPDRGYSAMARFVAAANELVGSYVHVLADDTPGVGGVADPL